MSIRADLHLSLRLRDEVSEDGVASVSHKGTGLEDVDTTDCGGLTKLFVAGAETLHDCTQEATLEGGGGGRRREGREEERREGREGEERGGGRGGKRRKEERRGGRREEKLKFVPHAVIT